MQFEFPMTIQNGDRRVKNISNSGYIGKSYSFKPGNREVTAANAGGIAMSEGKDFR